MTPRSFDVDELVDHVRAWIAQHDSTRIPQNAVSDDGYPLGTRTRYIRERHRTGLLERSTAARLEAIPGWAWTVRRPRTTSPHPEGIPAEWQDRFNQVIAFLDEHGTLTGCSTGIHTWLRQQTEYSRRGRLSAEQTAAIEAHPQLAARIRRGWAPYGSRVSILVEQLQQWLRESDAPDLTQITRESTVTDEDGRPVNLWRRCKYYRERHRAGLLPEEEAALLEQLPGWRWEIPAGNPQWRKS